MAQTFVTASRDGTKIAYDKVGRGPIVVIVGGALSSRKGWTEPKLAQLLASDYTVVTYDRRGRGDSTDTQPYTPEREIEDIEALLNEFDGSGYLYGISSGAALALYAASELNGKIRKLVIYDTPYDSSEDGRKATREYNKQLAYLLANDNRGDAMALFMKFVGTPIELINGMRNSPMWTAMETLAPTLAYDSAVLVDDRSVPVEMAARVTALTLIIYGEKIPHLFVKPLKLLKKQFQTRNFACCKARHTMSSLKFSLPS
ncbi:MAG TPA: alpha/beta hydrolase [Candidatus Binatia bacterium]|nr:alpha/beta hydrolase [Candidatus Binatia bacterium]